MMITCQDNFTFNSRPQSKVLNPLYINPHNQVYLSADATFVNLFQYLQQVYLRSVCLWR